MGGGRRPPGDAHRAAEVVVRLGGNVVAAPEETPFGVLATATDPAGAETELRAIKG